MRRKRDESEGKLVVLVIVVLITGIFAFVIYLNIRAYNRYAYYVEVTDEQVFDAEIDTLDPRIVHHERGLKVQIIEIDKRIDGGDGGKKGKLRWAECYGIDCDEGWDTRSYK